VQAQFWLSSENSASGRSAVVADEGESLWLYLTERDSAKIAADCWLFNRAPARTGPEVLERSAEYRERGAPPPAAAEVIDDSAVLTGDLDQERVRIVWSPDGESVATWVDGSLAGYIVAGARRGHSSHLRIECPWGAPLDAEQYQRVFEFTAGETGD
jgi:hypothetical protein